MRKTTRTPTRTTPKLDPPTVTATEGDMQMTEQAEPVLNKYDLPNDYTGRVGLRNVEIQALPGYHAHLWRYNKDQRGVCLAALPEGVKPAGPDCPYISDEEKGKCLAEDGLLLVGDLFVSIETAAHYEARLERDVREPARTAMAKLGSGVTLKDNDSYAVVRRVNPQPKVRTA